MKPSRYYQNWIQSIGAGSEVVLFFSGFFLGKEMFVLAALLMIFKIFSKFLMSECMYKRMQAIFKEENSRD